MLLNNKNPTGTLMASAIAHAFRALISHRESANTFVVELPADKAGELAEKGELVNGAYTMRLA